jgi:hypothetical protein
MLKHVEMSDRQSTIGRDSIFRYKTIGILSLGILFMPLLSLMVPASASTGLNLTETEFQLSLIPSASKMPADRNSYFAIIQLQVADRENPIEAPKDMEITVISSDPSVISLPASKVTLMKGQSMVKMELMSTDKAGVASITAQSEGVKSSTTSVTTYRMDSLEPTRLAIYSAPNTFIPDPEFVGMLYIQVLNSQNLPAVSKIDIPVDISSSDSTIGRVPSYAVIPAGSSGIFVDFTPQRQVGQTTVKASAAGLSPGELIVNVDGAIPTKVVVEFAPNVVPAINYNDALMTVQLTDENDEPVKAAKLTRILLKSSDTSVLEVPQYVEILPGKSYASTYAVAKGKVGAATVTASATGYATGISSIDAVQMSDVGANDPKQLQIFSVPSVLPPDNSEHQTIVVAFQDMDGKPYRQISYFFQRIALSTSNTLVGEIASPTFLAKETYAVAKFKTKYTVGETEITASLEGYQPAQMTLLVGGSGPATVALDQIPEIIEANNFESSSLVVSLRDHNDKPVAAQVDTTVFLSSSDPEITRIQASITIPAGESHAIATAHATLRAGLTTLTGAADGLGSGSTAFRTVGFTGSISEYYLGLYVIPKLPADGKEYEAVIVQLQDQAGLPVLAKSDVQVSLSSGSLIAGTIQESVVIPQGSGLVAAKFKTSLVEDEPFKITASSEGFTSVESEIETTTQPLSIYKTFELPTRADFGSNIPVSLDVYSGAIPIDAATVTITGQNAADNTVTTDQNGHAEGIYSPTMPGSNTIAVKVNKPGYQEAVITSRIVLDQLVDLTVSSETAAGNDVPAQLKVTAPKGVKAQSSTPNGSILYVGASWGSYLVSAPPQVSAPNAAYQFAHWSDGSTENPRTWNIVEDSTITAVYNAKYLLQINDVNGLAAGGGYYDEGETARISMGQTAVPGILTDKEFAGWDGAIKSASPSIEVTMDGPKTIEVQWKDSYLKIGLIGAAIGGGGFFYYWKIFKPKKELEEKQRAPDLDWYKA